MRGGGEVGVAKSNSQCAEACFHWDFHKNLYNEMIGPRYKRFTDPINEHLTTMFNLKPAFQIGGLELWRSRYVAMVLYQHGVSMVASTWRLEVSEQGTRGFVKLNAFFDCRESIRRNLYTVEGREIHLNLCAG